MPSPVNNNPTSQQPITPAQRELPSINSTSKESLESIRKSIAHLSQQERTLWANSKDANGKTPLVFAIEAHTAVSNKMDMIAFLIEDCKADPNLGDKDNWTPLYRASTGSHSQPLEYLLAHGANPNIANKDGSMPLHRIVDRGGHDDVKALLAHQADVNVMNGFGTPLAYAAKNGNIDIANLLLDAGADSNLVNDPLTATPVELASNNKKEEMKQLLLSRNGHETLPADSKVHTDISRLVQAGDKEAILKSFVNDLPDVYGRSAAHYCAHQGKVDILKEMAALGNIDKPDNKLHTPLHYSVIKGHEAAVSFLISNEVKGSLISQDDQGYGPLTLACQFNRVTIAKELLQSAKENNVLDLVLSMKDKFGWTLLHKSAQVGNLDLVRMFVEEYKFDPNQEIEPGKGRTALVLAKATSAASVVEYLESLNPTIAEIINKV